MHLRAATLFALSSGVACAAARALESGSGDKVYDYSVDFKLYSDSDCKDAYDDVENTLQTDSKDIQDGMCAALEANPHFLRPRSAPFVCLLSAPNMCRLCARTHSKPS